MRTPQPLLLVARPARRAAPGVSRRMPLGVAVMALLAGALLAKDARAEGGAGAEVTHRYGLELSGVRHGLVRATELPATPSTSAAPALPARVVVSAQEVAPSLASVIDLFARGKPVKRDMRLTSGAILRKANDTRLVSVKLPALGSGGSADVELAFAVAAPLATQPVLFAKDAPPPLAGARIAGFRVDVAGTSALEAPKLDAITVTQKADGSATTGEIAFEVAAGGAAPFVAWNKTSATRTVPRAVAVEYIDGAASVVLKLRLDRCSPVSVKPMGTSGTTRITLACSGLRAE